MAYDKKLLAAARRKLERDREAHEDAMEARRRDVYAKEPRIRAIDRELSATAIQVLSAALEQGKRPNATSAIASLGLSDWLTNKPLCEKCGDTGYEGAATCECVKRRYARLLKEQRRPCCPSRTRTSASSTSATIPRAWTRT